jgi:hypothetical protein
MVEKTPLPPFGPSRESLAMVKLSPSQSYIFGVF